MTDARPSEDPLDHQACSIAEHFIARVDAAVPGLLDKVYVTGSALTYDWQPSGSDVDLVLVVRRPVTEQDAPLLTAVHAATNGVHPVDGIYLTAEQLATGPDGIESAPQSITANFVLARPQGQPCWVTWVELSASPVARVSAGGVSWTPAEPPRIGDLGARAAAYSRANLDLYWAPLGERADAELAKLSADAEVEKERVTWVALGPARLLITMETGRVVSKSAGARWAAERWPEFAGLVEKAIRSRQGDGETFSVEEACRSVELLRRCVETAHAASFKSSPYRPAG